MLGLLAVENILVVMAFHTFIFTHSLAASNEIIAIPSRTMGREALHQNFWLHFSDENNMSSSFSRHSRNKTDYYNSEDWKIRIIWDPRLSANKCLLLAVRSRPSRLTIDSEAQMSLSKASISEEESLDWLYNCIKFCSHLPPGVDLNKHMPSVANSVNYESFSG